MDVQIYDLWWNSWYSPLTFQICEYTRVTQMDFLITTYSLLSIHLNAPQWEGFRRLERPPPRGHLRKVAGNVTRFPEFVPRSVFVRDVMEVLLNFLYSHQICCHLSECFVTYIAQIFNKDGSMSVYSQKRRAPSQHTVPGWGHCGIYRSGRVSITVLRTRFRRIWWSTTSHGEFSVQLNVIGIDSVPCGLESNVDFFGLGHCWTVFLHTALHHSTPTSRRT